MVERGHVVEEFMLGNTKVRICDDYCRDKTKEDVEKILESISQKVSGPYFYALAQKEREKEEKAKKAAAEKAEA